MNYSILVVDDDDDDLILLANHIKRYHQDVSLTHAQNGEDAIQKLTSGLQPHLIMVDAQMPIMNGYEFLEWRMHSERWQPIPVVVWTGGLSDADILRYYQAGANSLMFKQNALQNMESFCHHWFKLVHLPQFALAD